MAILPRRIFHQAEAVLNRSRMLGFSMVSQFSRLESVIIPLLTLNTGTPLRETRRGPRAFIRTR